MSPESGPFRYETSVTMRDTDAGGVMFFGSYFGVAHDAYEAFLNAHGFGFDRMLSQEDFIVTVVHAESEHKRPLFPGERVTILLTVEEIRRRVFTLRFEIQNSVGEAVCHVKTVHVPVSRSKGKAIPVPESLAEVLRRAMPA